MQFRNFKCFVEPEARVLEIEDFNTLVIKNFKKRNYEYNNYNERQRCSKIDFSLIIHKLKCAAEPKGVSLKTFDFNRVIPKELCTQKFS